MSCETYRQRIIERIADELDEAEAILLEQHLAACAECAAEERRLRDAIERALPPIDARPHPAMEETLLAHLPSPRSQRCGRLSEIRGRFLRPIPSYAAAALLIIALGAGYWAGASRIPESVPRTAQAPSPHVAPARGPDAQRAGDLLQAGARPGLAGGAIRFLAAPLDGVDLVESIPPDTL